MGAARHQDERCQRKGEKSEGHGRIGAFVTSEPSMAAFVQGAAGDYSAATAEAFGCTSAM